MLDFAIFAVTFLLALVAAVLYLYPVTASRPPGLRPPPPAQGARVHFILPAVASGGGRGARSGTGGCGAGRGAGEPRESRGAGGAGCCGLVLGSL